MLIGQLAQQAGVSKDTVRLYAKLGLLVARDRPAGSRVYQDFDEQALERLAFIQHAKDLGFTLSEIKQILDQCQQHGPLPADQKIAIVERKLAEISQKIDSLRQIEAYLHDKLAQLQRDRAAEASPVSPAAAQTRS